MVSVEDPIKSPENPSKKQPGIDENLFSPRFRSVAAMAGWDEEALLIASVIVEDTPDRQFKHKKRSDFQGFKTPPTNSRRKRKAQRRSPASSIPVAVLNLDEDETQSKQESRRNDEVNIKGSGVSSSTPAIPCIDQLREELSCVICLEICFEPSTTPCGHSFCKKCLCMAADKCGKRCPKCRQLISNSRYCKVNTVLWNTIQLLFPQEVEARKQANSVSESHETRGPIPSRTRSHSTLNRVVEALNSPESETNVPERRRNNPSSRRDVTRTRMRTSVLPSQDEDAALALRLQREEFMEAFREPSNEERRNSLAVARANLRAMASRAVNVRIRGRRD